LGKFQNIPLKTSAFFYFGKSISRHAEAWSKLIAFSRALNSNDEIFQSIPNKKSLPVMYQQAPFI